MVPEGSRERGHELGLAGERRPQPFEGRRAQRGAGLLAHDRQRLVERHRRPVGPVGQALEIVRELAGTALCPAAVAGLEAALVEEPEFVATLATTLETHEGLRPAVRRPA